MDADGNGVVTLGETESYVNKRGGLADGSYKYGLITDANSVLTPRQSSGDGYIQRGNSPWTVIGNEAANDDFIEGATSRRNGTDRRQLKISPGATMHMGGSNDADSWVLFPSPINELQKYPRASEFYPRYQTSNAKDVMYKEQRKTGQPTDVRIIAPNNPDQRELDRSQEIQAKEDVLKKYQGTSAP